MYAGNLAVVNANDSNGCLAMWSGCTEVEASTLEALAKSRRPYAAGHWAENRASRALTALAGKDEIVVTVTPITMALVRKVPLGSPRPTGMWTMWSASAWRLSPMANSALSRVAWRGCLSRFSMRGFTGTPPTSPTCWARLSTFQGVPLRDRGGVYIVPQARIAAWQAFADAVTAAGAAHCHSVPVAYGERFTRLAVESIRTHVANTLADIRDAVETGNLGARALKGL